jgi:hypothetical protein
MTPSSVRDKAISLADVGVVLAYVGRTSTNSGAFYFNSDLNGDGYPDGPQLDRLPSSVPNEPWRANGPGSTAISLLDVGVILDSVGHSCSGPP